MTKEQEAQQAQTIARIKQEYERHSGRTYHAFTDFAPLVTELYANLSVLLEIVDSQAQKIAEQAKEIEILQRIKRAAISAEYYQGTEGTAQELEDALKMTTDQTTDSKEVV